MPPEKNAQPVVSAAFVFIGTLLLASALLFCSPLAGRVWAGNKAKAGPEVMLWREVQHFLQQGRDLQACKTAVELKKYAETPTYAKAKKGMLRYGYSLEDPLGSYTLKQIIKLQNVLEPVRRREGRMPTVGKRKSHRDAWNTPLRVELVARGSYIYIIRSAGPDRRYITGDDYIVGVRGGYSIKKSQVKSMEDSSRQKGRIGLLRGRDSDKREDGPGAPRLTMPGKGSGAKGDEVQVELNDLLKK